MVIAAICIGVVPSLWKGESEKWSTGRTEYFAESRRRSVINNRQKTMEGRIISFLDRLMRKITDKMLYAIATLLGIVAALQYLS